MAETLSIARASRRRHLGSLLALAFVAVVPPLRAQTAGASIGGVSFGGRAEVGGEQLRLNGVGLRASAFIKGFAAALYLAQNSSSAEQVLHAPGAKRLRMRMLLEVPIEVLVHAVHKGIQRNLSEPQQGALTDRLGTLDATLRAIGKVFDGDVIDLDYLPGAGLVVALNGKSRAAPIPGEDLYAAVMQVFIGERPVDAKLKAGLLGQRKA
jgi:flagellar motor switch/type III secretory pathway protein FliN